MRQVGVVAAAPIEMRGQHRSAAIPAGGRIKRDRGTGGRAEWQGVDDVDRALIVLAEVLQRDLELALPCVAQDRAWFGGSRFRELEIGEADTLRNRGRELRIGRARIIANGGVEQRAAQRLDDLSAGGDLAFRNRRHRNLDDRPESRPFPDAQGRDCRCCTGRGSEAASVRRNSNRRAAGRKSWRRSGLPKGKASMNWMGLV